MKLGRGVYVLIMETSEYFHKIHIQFSLFRHDVNVGYLISPIPMR